MGRDVGYKSTTLAEAMAWAKSEGIAVPKKNPLNVINGYRLDQNLPRFMLGTAVQNLHETELNVEPSQASPPQANAPALKRPVPLEAVPEAANDVSVPVLSERTSAEIFVMESDSKVLDGVEPDLSAPVVYVLGADNEAEMVEREDRARPPSFNDHDLIRTSQDLRKMLMNEMLDLRNGVSDPRRAQAMANLARQVVAVTAIEFQMRRKPPSILDAIADGHAA